MREVRKTVNQNTEAVERMKKYMAERLREAITARDVAKAAGYSQYLECSF